VKMCALLKWQMVGSVGVCRVEYGGVQCLCQEVF
jgi:hypothetical protein